MKENEVAYMFIFLDVSTNRPEGLKRDLDLRYM